ncbi:MAG: quinone-dependent dihydroorotate dehydrogenase [Alphaproteobacteria bacterium]|nr:quinone-dependent dihydroorotate dehydrogenase [Alphaproteobacteria bacterium]
MHPIEQSVLRKLNPQALSFLSRCKPERAHEWAVKALRLYGRFPWGATKIEDPRLASDVFGLHFPNPLGLAAGFDKNGEVLDAAFRLGFGFSEVGTITPRPQEGNPGRSRLVRLDRDLAVINWLGFPSEGHGQVHARLLRRAAKPGIVGVNLGANKASTDRVADYHRGIEAFVDVADYFTINISSPNTPGLRDLQKFAALDELLARVLASRNDGIEKFGRKPVLLKIAPDVTLAELDDIVKCARARKIDGMIVSNTTVTRPTSLLEASVSKQGGLSGRPLFRLSTQKLAAAYLRVENQFPLVGVGGVENADTALAKIEAGATLIQLCTSFVFKGLLLAEEINEGLSRLLAQKAYPRLTDAVGVTAADVARLW